MCVRESQILHHLQKDDHHAAGPKFFSISRLLDSAHNSPNKCWPQVTEQMLAILTEARFMRWLHFKTMIWTEQSAYHTVKTVHCTEIWKCKEDASESSFCTSSLQGFNRHCSACLGHSFLVWQQMLWCSSAAVESSHPCAHSQCSACLFHPLTVSAEPASSMKYRQP